MPPAAEHDLRRARSARAPPGSSRRRHPRRCRRWTASAAMRQCRASEQHQDAACHASSFSAAPRKRRLLGRTPRRARRSRRDAVACRPHRRAGAAAVPVRVGGFGGAAGLADYLVARAHRRFDRRDASLCQRHFGERRRGRARTARAVRGAAPAALGCRRRRPLDRGERCRAPRCARSARRRAASSSRSAATSSRRSPTRRSIAISSAASIRSIRRCRCRM